MAFSSHTPFYKKKPFIIVSINVLIIAAIAVFFISNNSDDKKEAATTTTTSTTRKPIRDSIATLTGQVDPTGEAGTRPALAIKIGNNPEARPQAGITEADIMYEEIVEGGITRYMGIYNSTVPERVGPVRSVRGMDPNIALNWGGVFAYSGGAEHNEVKIKATKGVVALNETAAGDGMVRDSSRKMPNNLYAIPSVLYKKGGEPIPPKTQFKYSDDVSLLADPASSFLVSFKSGYECKWVWDATKEKYMRFYGANKVVDQKGVQVAMDNVVVQFINYPDVSEGITTGSGNVWVFRNGKVVKGTWDRPSTDRPATFSDSEGNVIKLHRGQTWVELANTTTPVPITP